MHMLISADPCDPQPCLNNGTCYGIPAKAKVTVAYTLCMCQPGFTGFKCENSTPESVNVSSTAPPLTTVPSLGSTGPPLTTVPSLGRFL